MRDFINAIFDLIVAASLTDDEFATVSIDLPVYSVELYDELLAIIDSREGVSSTRERLRYLFLAQGVSVPETVVSKSNIFIGAVLD